MRVILKQLRGRAGLTPLNGKRVLFAGFTDEDCENFIITFSTGKSGEKRDLLISFESRTPAIYVSEAYTAAEEPKKSIEKKMKKEV